MPPLEQRVTFSSEGVLTADFYSTHNVKAFEGVIPPVAKTNQRRQVPFAAWDCQEPAQLFPAWCLEAVTDPHRYCFPVVQSEYWSIPHKRNSALIGKEPLDFSEENSLELPPATALVGDPELLGR